MTNGSKALIYLTLLFFLLHWIAYGVLTAVKFGLSEKHTKFEKIFLMILKNQLISLVIVKTMRKIFSNVCFSNSPNFT